MKKKKLKRRVKALEKNLIQLTVVVSSMMENRGTNLSRVVVLDALREATKK